MTKSPKHSDPVCTATAFRLGRVRCGKSRPRFQHNDEIPHALQTNPHRLGTRRPVVFTSEITTQAVCQSSQLAQEIGSRLSTRVEGTCIKHRMGSASVKIYDKFDRVMRIETTTNDVSFFKHHRKVEHKNGTETRELAALKKSIYSLIDLREIHLGCNRRYLDFLSSLDDYSDGQRALQKITEPKTGHNMTWRGFNFFAATDQALLRAVLNPKFTVHGWRRADLKPYLSKLSDSVLSRQIKRLRVFGMIKRVPGTYRYYLTKLGRTATAACVRVTEFTILPTLATTA